MLHETTISKTVEWLTPPEYIKELGPFDLDPCSPIGRPWDTAKKHYTIRDNGLIQKWQGRVWLNPPYGSRTGGSKLWLELMAKHNHGIAMIPAKVETRIWHNLIWPNISGILFIKGRPRFHKPDGTRGEGNAGMSICLVSYGDRDAEILENSNIEGKFIRL